MGSEDRPGALPEEEKKKARRSQKDDDGATRQSDDGKSGQELLMDWLEEQSNLSRESADNVDNEGAELDSHGTTDPETAEQVEGDEVDVVPDFPGEAHHSTDSDDGDSGVASAAEAGEDDSGENEAVRAARSLAARYREMGLDEQALDADRIADELAQKQRDHDARMEEMRQERDALEQEAAEKILGPNVDDLTPVHLPNGGLAFRGEVDGESVYFTLGGEDGLRRVNPDGTPYDEQSDEDAQESAGADVDKSEAREELVEEVASTADAVEDPDSQPDATVTEEPAPDDTEREEPAQGDADPEEPEERTVTWSDGRQGISVQGADGTKRYFVETGDGRRVEVTRSGDPVGQDAGAGVEDTVQRWASEEERLFKGGIDAVEEQVIRDYLVSSEGGRPPTEEKLRELLEEKRSAHDALIADYDDAENKATANALLQRSGAYLGKLAARALSLKPRDVYALNEVFTRRPLPEVLQKTMAEAVSKAIKLRSEITTYKVFQELSDVLGKAGKALRKSADPDTLAFIDDVRDRIKRSKGLPDDPNVPWAVDEDGNPIEVTDEGGGQDIDVTSTRRDGGGSRAGGPTPQAGGGGAESNPPQEPPEPPEDPPTPPTPPTGGGGTGGGGGTTPPTPPNGGGLGSEGPIVPPTPPDRENGDRGIEIEDSVEFESGPNRYGIFTERVNLTGEFDQILNSLRRRESDSGAQQNLTEDEIQDLEQRISDEAYQRMQGRYRSLGYELHMEDVDGFPVVFFELNALDSAHCKAMKRFGNQAPGLDNLVVQLTLSGKADNYTMREKRALRTYDDRALKLEGEEHFVIDYFNRADEQRLAAERAEAAGEIPEEAVGFVDEDPDTRNGRYERYRSDVAGILHQLNAYARAENEDMKKKGTDSPQTQIANGIAEGADKLRERVSDKLTGDGVTVRIEQAKTVNGIPDPTSAEVTSEAMRWAPSLVQLDDAFEKDIAPLTEGINENVRLLNAGRLDVHDMAVTAESIVKLNERINSTEAGRTFRSDPGMNEASQAHMIGLQIDLGMHRNLVTTDFGMIQQDSSLEHAEENGLALMAARAAEEGILDDPLRVKMKYRARLASAWHKCVSGEEWNLLERVAERDVTVGSSADATPVTKRESAISAKVNKLMEVVWSDPRRYGDRLRGAFAIPVPRYFGVSKIPRGASQVSLKDMSKLEAADYLRIDDVLSLARRGGPRSDEDQRQAIRREAQTLRRNCVFLGDIISKPAGDLVAGAGVGYKVPQLEIDFQRASADASSLGLEGMEAHEFIMRALSENPWEEDEQGWGYRGIANYIEDKVEAMMEDSENREYASMVREKKRLEEDAARRGKADLKLPGERLSFSGFAERFAAVKDRAKGDFLAQYVYDPMFRENPALMMFFEDIAMSPEPLVREQMAHWLQERLGENVDVRRLTRDARALEIIAQHQFRNHEGDARVEVSPAAMEAVLEVIDSDLHGAELTAEAERLSQLGGDYVRQLLAIHSQQGRFLAAQVGLDHSLGIGPSNARFTAMEIDHGRVIVQHEGTDELGGISSLQDIIKEVREIVGSEGILPGSSIKSDKDAAEVGKALKKEALKLAGKVTANKSLHPLIMARLAPIFASAVIDQGSAAPLIGGSQVKTFKVSKRNWRYILIRNMTDGVVPVDNFSLDTKGARTTASMNLVTRSDMVKAFNEHEGMKKVFDIGGNFWSGYAGDSKD